MDKSHKSAVIIAGLYALFAGCWILFSDLALQYMFDGDRWNITLLQTLKGWFFVAVTAIFLYLAIKRFSRQIEEAFKLDGMTHLLSHDLFELQLSNLVENRKYDEKIVVGVLDIRHFKEINAKYGFNKANQLIMELAKEISNISHSNSLICRLPPDQFMLARVFSDDIDFEVRLTSYSELVSKVASVVEVEARCCIGVAFCPSDGTDAKQLMDAAVEALRFAKVSGNIVQYHDKALTEQSQARRKFLEELKAAIKDEKLTVVYQPKYKVASQEVSGVEVLVRWQHAERGLISPAKFIPLAEEFGLSLDISKLVVRRTAAELLGSGLLGNKLKHVAINVSATEFNNPADMEELLACIKTFPELVHYLRIEITETATLTNIEQSSTIINSLRDEGLSVSVDDFGTGYSSLAMLKDLTIDELKIDRSFVSGLSEGGRSKTIVNAIIGMANSFDINVVAEGVEAEDQLDILKSMGCAEVQGFFLGVPMGIEALKKHVNHSA